MTKMTEVKVAELSGKALDWAVAQADGRCLHERIRIVRYNDDSDYICEDCGKDTYMEPIRQTWKPSTDWSQGGPLIEKHNIQTSYNGNGFHRSTTGKHWCAYVCKPHGPERASGSGPTPLIAACRAIVAAKFVDTISVPAELITPAAS
ncbi:hypothetical protein K32_49280 [Kaistia sp. 32K]|uniref:phage protein NinX family protein n=1 Tax=Kaistia sp. 32K TaxID=2795690 RepID=UPI001916896F|nr:phage protein NinX family protein [Kaistia sp. 32K]BCP56311.1 hypothetical protein K32_49280 [Kaistia sp. 32K]